MVGIETPTEAQFKSVFEGIKNGLNKALELASEIAADSLVQAAGFFGYAKGIFEAVTAALQTLKALAEAEPIDVARWNIFSDGVKGMADAILRSVQDAVRARDASYVFKDAMLTVKENTLAGLEAGLSAATELAAMLRNAGADGQGNFSFNSNFTTSGSPSFAAAAFTNPSSASLPASAYSNSGEQSFYGDIVFNVTAEELQEVPRLMEMIASLRQRTRARGNR